MNIIKEAGKIAQSFLSIDDIALGQNLVSGGFRQLGKVGISPAGPSIAVNVGARAFCLGAQLATRSAALPLKGGAKTVANLASDRAKELGERCSTLAIQGIELAGGKKAQNPITKGEWLNRQAQPGYNASELTADSTLGTFQELAMASLSIGANAVRTASEKLGADGIVNSLDTSLDKLPGSEYHADILGRRQELVTVAVEAGMPLAQSAATFATAAARLAFADSRALHEEMTKGLARAEFLARDETPDSHQISPGLKKSAKKMANNPPLKFIAALEKDPNGKVPKPAAILSAMAKDSRALVTFFAMYPRIFSMLSSDLMVLAGAPTVKKPGQEADDGTSATITLLETLIASGLNENGDNPLFSRATVLQAQDLAYEAHRDREGSKSALDRIQRLFGDKARERISNDVSLIPEIADREEEGQASVIREYIQGISDCKLLSNQIDHCSERLADLEHRSSSGKILMRSPQTKRINALRLFTSLAASDLALRNSQQTSPEDARSAFCDWSSTQS